MISNMVRKTAVHFIFGLLLLGGSCVYAQNRYSQAAEIDDSEFLSTVKEVSLDLQSDNSLAQYISLAAQRNEIVSALAGYGIAVRPNAQVTLAVRVTDHRPVVEYRNVRTNVVQEIIVVHGIYFNLRFFVKAAALRNGKLHLVWVAPETCFAGRNRAEDNSTRKFLLGDSTQQDNQKMFVNALADCLKALAPPVPPEPTSLQGIRAAAARQQAPPPVAAPWAVNSWTERAKAAVDAEFVRIMSPGMPVDKTALEGIAGAPEIVLDPHFEHDDCKADAAWRSRWAGVFQRLHWAEPQQPPTISLKHFFSCVYAYGAPPRYFALSDSILLEEANVVFPLNGKVVRKLVDLVTAHHEQYALEDDLGSRLDDFLPRNIQDFLTDLVLGNSADVPPIPSRPNPPAAGVPQAPRSVLAAVSASANPPAAPPPPKVVTRTSPPAQPAPPAQPDPPARPDPPADDPIGGGGFITPPSSFKAMLCVPRKLVEQDAWDHPESGSRMDAFKRVVGTYVVSVAKPGFEYWVGAGQFERFDSARPASGANIVSVVSPDSDRFDIFDPQCPANYALYQVQVNH
jgi:hypothetical protein